MALLNRLFFILITFIFLLPAFCWAQSSPRQAINFDEGWKFHLGHAASAEKDFNYGLANIFAKSGNAKGTAIDAAFKDSAWTTVNLPHDWAVELPFENSADADLMAHGYKTIGGHYPANSIGWYRKHFRINKADSGHRFQIQFDGIFRDAHIWLNGFALGNNQSGYVGAAYDITDFIHFDKENVLVVRADATQSEGWFYEGAGIYRHVWLNQFNNLHLAQDGVFAYSSVQNNKATVTVETTVANDNSAKANYTLSAYLTDRNGKIVASSTAQPFNLNNGEEKTSKQTISFNNPRLWSIEEPYLYRVVVQVQSGNQLMDTKTLRFGIRTIDIKTNGVFVNGKHVKIYGTNNHQDHAGLGSALPDALQYYRIGLLKEMGVNAYRTSHHPPTIELLDACDSLGILVLDEQRLLNSSPEYLNQFERLVKRDRSRACVFLWSIGNEESLIQTNSLGKRIAQTFISKQKQLDPTRTCTYAADVPNVFKGVNEVIPVRSFNYRHAAVAAYHKDHASQPILGTEMGSTVTTRGIYEKDSIRGYVPDQDISAPWWASKAEDWWKEAADKDYWLGGFVWTGFDYRGEPTPYQWPNINSHFGIMDMCGFPKNIYYYYQSWWTDRDVLHLSPHWNWPNKMGQPIEVWVNSNADNVELFLNGNSLGKKEMPRNGHLNWMVNYAPGKLEAIAFKKGKRLKASMETTTAAYKLVVTPNKTTSLADGKDATVINITVVDKQGREVPDANNPIQFALTGNAKIIGVGNGDPSSHEADKCVDGQWQRSLFNGKCQVIVQAGTQADTLHFEARSAGLEIGAVNMVTK